MGKAQDGQKSKAGDGVEGSTAEKLIDPRKLLEDLLKRTEEMEKRLAQIIQDCENLGVFDESRGERRFRPRFFGR